MITRKDLQEVLDSITYKPGYFFKIQSQPLGIILEAKFPDSDNPFKKVSVSSYEGFPYNSLRGIDRDYIIDAAFRIAKRFENHEVEEWFKVNQKHHINPHPDGPEKTYEIMIDLETGKVDEEI